MWETFKVTKETLMGLVASHIEKQNPGVIVNRSGSLGLLSAQQPEEEECWVSDFVEVTMDVTKEAIVTPVPESALNNISLEQTEADISPSANVVALYEKMALRLTGAFPPNKIVSDPLFSAEEYRALVEELRDLSDDDKYHLLVLSAPNINLFFAVFSLATPQAISKAREIKSCKMNIMSMLTNTKKFQEVKSLDKFYAQIRFEVNGSKK